MEPNRKRVADGPPAPAAAPGLERRILRRLPLALVVGTAAPLAAAFAMRWWRAADDGVSPDRSQPMVDALAAGIVFLVWTLVVTIAIGCIVVIVMKGPRRTADSYQVPDRDRPESD